MSLDPTKGMDNMPINKKQREKRNDGEKITLDKLKKELGI